MNNSEGPIVEHQESAFDPHVLEQLKALVHEPFESYTSLHTRLEKSGQLEAVVRHVERLYSVELGEAGFLTKNDWEMLAALWICDEETASHSVETYRIAHARIDRPIDLENHTLVISLAKEFFKEGVSKEQFLRAALLHDIGKLAMPIQVLVNHVTDKECADILFSHYRTLGEVTRTALGYAPGQVLPLSGDALLQELRKALVRPQSLVPVREMLSSDTERLALEDDLRHLGLSLDASLLTVMQTHDGYSRTILNEERLPIEAALAGAHHRHQEEYTSSPHTITIGTLQVSVDLADVIHLADVTQAMESKRHYKDPESALMVLSTLVEHATHNMVDPFITYLWVADEMERTPPPADPDDFACYTSIKKFLDDGRGFFEKQLKVYHLAPKNS